MRRRGKSIIWPQYMDSNRTWSKGRRLPKSECIPLPSLKELAEAAIQLGYDIDIEPNARYPRTWWDPPGYLLINTKGQKKVKIMEKLIPVIKKIRAEEKAKKAAMEKSKKKKKKQKKIKNVAAVSKKTQYKKIPNKNIKASKKKKK
ncbi:MAG: signal recognition particle subunit SRP19/SEC65 family protein [Promethearchaeota archaeon]